MTEKTQFEYIGKSLNSVLDDVTYDVYEARFPLVDDGTPGSSNELIVRILTNPEDAIDTEVEVLVHSCGNTMKLVGGEAKSQRAVTNALYNAARIITKKSYSPL